MQDNAGRFLNTGCNVIIVCKGSKEGGKKWRQRIGIQLRVYADENSHLVESFDFPLSVWNAAKSTSCYGLAYKIMLNTIPQKDDPKADLYQMGGEVLMDSSGNVLHVHKCKTPEDRPTCDDLLHLIEHSSRSQSVDFKNQEPSGKSKKKCIKFCAIL